VAAGWCRLVRQAQNQLRWVQGSPGRVRKAPLQLPEASIIIENLDRPPHTRDSGAGRRHGPSFTYGERDCSSCQRAHQKLRKESPSGLDPDPASPAMGEAAIARPQDNLLRGGGTVEFLPSKARSGNFFSFMEMNTRMPQVDIRSTERLTGWT